MEVAKEVNANGWEFGATEQALYDLDHPKVYVSKNIEVQQAQIKEREFYDAFLEKLEEL